MYFKRKAYNKLLEWKENYSDKYAVLLEGARRVGKSTNRKLMKDLRIYMAVGGMPQAVEAYLEGENFSEIDQVKRQIISLYEEELKKLIHLEEYLNMDEFECLCILEGGDGTILDRCCYDYKNYSYDKIKEQIDEQVTKVRRISVECIQKVERKSVDSKLILGYTI